MFFFLTLRFDHALFLSGLNACTYTSFFFSFYNINVKLRNEYECHNGICSVGCDEKKSLNNDTFKLSIYSFTIMGIHIYIYVYILHILYNICNVHIFFCNLYKFCISRCQSLPKRHGRFSVIVFLVSSSPRAAMRFSVSGSR